MMVSTWACDGTERSPGTTMSNAALTDSQRTLSGNGAEAPMPEDPFGYPAAPPVAGEGGSEDGR